MLLFVGLLAGLLELNTDPEYITPTMSFLLLAGERLQ
jgi:hypothetical protein